jgi:hypothetical protein
MINVTVDTSDDLEGTQGSAVNSRSNGSYWRAFLLSNLDQIAAASNFIARSSGVLKPRFWWPTAFHETGLACVSFGEQAVRVAPPK